MTGSVYNFGDLVRRATNEGMARKYLFVCPTGVKYIDGRFVSACQVV